MARFIVENTFRRYCCLQPMGPSGICRSHVKQEKLRHIVRSFKIKKIMKQIRWHPPYSGSPESETNNSNIVHEGCYFGKILVPKQLRAVRIVLHKTKILTQRRREAYETISFNSINRFQIWIQYVGSCTLLATGNSYYDLQIYGQVAIRWTADLPNPTESTGGKFSSCYSE